MNINAANRFSAQKKNEIFVTDCSQENQLTLPDIRSPSYQHSPRAAVGKLTPADLRRTLKYGKGFVACSPRFTTGSKKQEFLAMPDINVKNSQ